MKDLQRAKYLKLMKAIEKLEAAVEKEEQKKKQDPAKLQSLQEELASQRNELQRISDGCGTGRGQ